MTFRRLIGSAAPSAWPAALAGAGALALYAATRAPGLTWAHNGADGGDLLAAALTGGVPHPSGYPTYQLLLRGALAMFHRPPAATGTCCSALAAAVAVGFVADLIRRTLPERPWRNALAFIAALSWATAPSLWSQAVITEVYALHVLFASIIVWLAWRWAEASSIESRRTWTWLAMIALVLGIGLGNHLSLILILPGLLAWFWSNRDGERSRWGKQFRWPLLVILLLSGVVSVYGYVPLAAAGDSPVVWGDPVTPGGFWWLVSGKLYRSFLFGVDLRYLPGRLAAWISEMLRQFGGPWGALLALLGLWQLDQIRHALWRFTGLIALAFSAYAIGYDTGDSYVYLIPVWAVAAIWLAHGADRLLILLSGRVREWRPRWRGPVIIGGVVALAVACPMASIAKSWGSMNLRNDHSAIDFVEETLESAAPEAVILTATDEPTFALWYARYGLGQRPDVTPVNINLYAYDWYRRRLLAEHDWLSSLTMDGDLPLLGEFLTRVADSRPLYRTEELGLSEDGLREESAGALVRLVRQR